MHFFAPFQTANILRRVFLGLTIAYGTYENFILGYRLAL